LRSWSLTWRPRVDRFRARIGLVGQAHHRSRVRAAFTPVPRRLQPSLRAGLESAPVVALVGARQVGKTSLARNFERDERPFVSLDDLANLAQARFDPSGFIAGIGPGAIIDEVQRVPALLLAIKAAVDRSPARGRFLLTGSANIMTLPKLSESLAGRVNVYELFPFAEAEIERVECNVADQLFEPDRPWRAEPLEASDLIRRIVRGGYPEAVAQATSSRARWFASYLLAMLQRDIREIANVSDFASMSRLLAVLCARTGRIVNYTSLSSESSIPKTTLLRYVSLFERAYLLYRMPAWSFDLGRRLARILKLFIGDTGIAANQMNVDAARVAADRNLLGGLLETFVANELRKHASWSERRISIYHYREHGGLEVDFILEAAGGQRVAVEVKATASPTASDTRGLLRLMDDPKLALVRGVLVHTGSTVVPIRSNVHGVPVSVFWSEAS
jgi:predicted AAA+ superfamily ATPase